MRYEFPSDCVTCINRHRLHFYSCDPLVGQSVRTTLLYFVAFLSAGFLLLICVGTLIRLPYVMTHILGWVCCSLARSVMMTIEVTEVATQINVTTAQGSPCTSIPLICCGEYFKEKNYILLCSY